MSAIRRSARADAIHETLLNRGTSTPPVLEGRPSSTREHGRLELVEPPGDDVVDRRLALLVAADGRDEDLALEFVDLCVASRDTRCDAGDVVKQRDLPEVLAGSERRHELAAVNHVDLARPDEVEAFAPLPLPDDR